MSVYVDTDITRRVKEFLPELIEPANEETIKAVANLKSFKTQEEFEEFFSKYEFVPTVICRIHLKLKE